MLIRQVSAGVIVGLSAVIYSITYGSLLFSGPLIGYVGFGVTVALITAIIGALFGMFSDETTFISGPDSNTISVMAGTLASIGSIGLNQITSLGQTMNTNSLNATALPGAASLNMAMEAIFFTTTFCALAFYVLHRLKLSGLVRYIPYSVMAGFLASTGWLMCSGALIIIADTPLSMLGVGQLISEPFRPELFIGLLVVVALYALGSRISTALVIPLVMVASTIVVNVLLSSPLCAGNACNREDWLFAGLSNLEWLPPWKLDFSPVHLKTLLPYLPSMLVVSFIGLLTILLSLASLELNYRREFDLDRALKEHSVSAGLAALFGGFVGIISVARTTLNQKSGGGSISGLIAALICFAVLLGAGGFIAYAPKAALGGLVLYLGLNMLKQWLWDLRHVVSKFELMQILMILGLVANFGYMVGFTAGLMIACIFFVITYSSFPLTSLDTDLSMLSSSVVRPGYQIQALRAHGQKIKVYRLSGYVFFGSAKKIEMLFKELEVDQVQGLVLDFSNVSGIDRSAISVLQRILGRYIDKQLHIYFVHSPANATDLRSISLNEAVTKKISYFPSLDLALESAEEALLISNVDPGHPVSCFEFLDNQADREIFLDYCESRRVGRDEALCHEGDGTDGIYFVEDGSFEIIKIVGDNRLRLAKLSQGAMVGEMAFYTGAARSASIVAAVDSRVHILYVDALARMRTKHPDLAMKLDHMVICQIAESLIRANKLIATLG